MTKIQWTDETWNPIRGCSAVSPGCEHCYAAGVAYRFSGKGLPYEGLARQTAHGPKWTGEVRLVPELLGLPLRWRKPRRIFVNSMSDLFHEAVSDEWLHMIFAAMAASPHHTFQVLTKRPERMRAYLTDPTTANRVWLAARKLDPFGDGRTVYQGHLRPPGEWGPLQELVPPEWPLPWVWLGVSCEDQAAADERIPLLLQTPAAVRWVSAEPLLGALDLDPLRWFPTDEAFARPPTLDWAVVGGESGPRARPCRVEWVRQVVEQCRDAQVPCYVKQLGAKPAGWCASLLIDGAIGHDTPDFCDLFESGEGGGCTDRCWYLKHRSGADPDEWPEDLRVREFPR